MLWVWLFLAIALVGLLTAVGYAVWLWHKAADLFGEVLELGKRLEEALELLEQFAAGALLPADEAGRGARV